MRLTATERNIIIRDITDKVKADQAKKDKAFLARHEKEIKNAYEQIKKLPSWVKSKYASYTMDSLRYTFLRDKTKPRKTKSYNELSLEIKLIERDHKTLESLVKAINPYK